MTNATPSPNVTCCGVERDVPRPFAQLHTPEHDAARDVDGGDGPAAGVGDEAWTPSGWAAVYRG